MQIKRLLFQNILAAGKEPVEILFPPTNGITLVKGKNFDIASESSNGAGKSSIIEAILIAIYGRTLRLEDGKPLTMQAMLHDEADVEGRVEIDFDNTKIIRTFTNKKSHVAYWINGIPQSTDASAIQVKKDLQDHIGINFETMCSILLFGQHHIFSFLEAGEVERRDVFENLLNLREYNLYEERARELRKETKKKIEILTSSYELTKSHLVSQKLMLDEQNAKFKSYVDSVNQDINKINNEIETLPDTKSLEKAWANYTKIEEARCEIKDKMDNLLKQVSKLSNEMYQKECEYQEQLKTTRKPLDDAVAAIEKKIATLESKRESYKQQIIADRKAAEALSGKIVNIDGNYQNKINALSNSAAVFAISNELFQAEKEGKAVKDKIANIESGIKTADEICPTCYGKVDPANAKSVIKHYNHELATLRVRYGTIASRLKNAEEKRDADIATVKSDWKKEKDAVYIEISEAKSKVDEYEKTVNKQYIAKFNELSENLSGAMKAVSDFVSNSKKNNDTVFGKLNTQKQKCTDEYALLEKQSESIKIPMPIISLSEIGTIVAKKESLVKELAAKKNALSENPYVEIVKSLTDSVSNIQNKVNEEANAVREQEKILPYYDWWVGSMGADGIKAWISSGIIPTLNEQIDYYLQLIYQGSISVKFDKFLNVEIKNNASKCGLKRYGQGSGGERRRIDIAIMLAFRQIMKMSTGKDPSCVWLDEIADNIDSPGLTWLFNVIEDLSKTSRVYIITHNPVLLDMLANYDKLCIEKKHGAMKLIRNF